MSNERKMDRVRRIAAMVIPCLGFGFALAQSQEAVNAPQVLTPENVEVNQTLPQFTPPSLRPSFSEDPSPLEIFNCHIFSEPLVPIGSEPTPEENRTLAKALLAFSARAANEDWGALTGFLQVHTNSPWRAALLCNLGLLYYHTGYFNRALSAWEESWKLAKGAREESSEALADRAAGELAKMNARLGRFDRLESLFRELQGRNIHGSATEKISGARAGLALMRNRPQDAFRCGPMALASLLDFRNPQAPLDERIIKSRSTLKGMSLLQVRDLSTRVGLNLRMAKRAPGSAILLPAVVHWKAGHYAALVDRVGDRYLVKDPTFGEDIWVAQAALDEEASGYFLIRSGPLPTGWNAVGNRDGGTVWGKGNTGSSDPNSTSSNDEKDGGSSNSGNGCNGMANYAFHAMLVSLNIEDKPVGITPPRGPSVLFHVTYNQREANQPANFTYANLGQKWTFDWLSYVIDDPANPVANVSQYLDGGGTVPFNNFNTATNSYTPQVKTGAILVRTSQLPIIYEKRMSDGSREVFSQPDGAASFPRKVFLTKRFTPAGDSIVFSFDSHMRIVAVKDALGQITTLAYQLASDSLKITQVTDPFGRFATFTYNASQQLIKITDVLGLTSQFTYGTGDFINSLITPYGTTVFAQGQIGTTRWLEATDPLGQKERMEYNDSSGIANVEPAPTGLPTLNSFMNFRNSFFWDKLAMRLYPGDFAKAVIYHWQHTTDLNRTGNMLESKRMPLESRVWYNYQNQTAPERMTDSLSPSPSKVARLMDDGSTQLSQYAYNRIGKMTQSIDPLGRETHYLYASNLVDLISTRQKSGSTTQLLDTLTYNAQHLPLTIVNASGQKTTMTYSSHGQMLTHKDPKGDLNTYTYNASGYLTKIQGPISSDSTVYTYDGFGRVQTIRRSDGYTLRYDYDALDRNTKISYPDGTFEQFVYNRLDMESHRDRRGLWTKTFFNALRQPVAKQDPLQRITNYDWCLCGHMKTLVDPTGNNTEWKRDLQGRVIEKDYADGSKETYAYEATTSRPISMTDAKGQITNYSYLIDDHLKQVTYANALVPTHSVSYTYDTLYNRVATMQDSLGTTSYAYYTITVPPALGAGALKSIDGPWSKDSIVFAYDSLGRERRRTINGVVDSVSYDSLGRVVSNTNALGKFQYKYVGATARLDSLINPKNQKTKYTYFIATGDFRLKDIININAAKTQLSKFSEAYDAEGQILTWTQQWDATTASIHNINYDAADQVLGDVVKSAATGNPVLKQYAYGYDKVGNRTNYVQDSTENKFAYNTLNELTAQSAGGQIRYLGTLSEPGTVTINGTPVPVSGSNQFDGMVNKNPVTDTVTIVAKDYSNNVRTSKYRIKDAGSAATFSYDNNGNLIGDGTRTYEWDAENRLTAIKMGTTRSEFTYDGLGRRVRITEKSGATITSKKSYLWVGNQIAEERDSTGATVSKRYFGFGVQVGTTKYFYTKDHLGSIREMSDTTGVIKARYEYDPYGTRTRKSGTLDADFGFTGHYLHLPSGLYLTKYRAYSAGLGRWISRDPIEERGGNNLYGYVLNNPGRFGDPLGLQLEEPPPEPEPDPFEPPGFEDPSEEDPNGEGQSGALPSPEEDPPSGEDSENKPPPSGNGGGGNCPSDATSNSNKSSRPTSAGKMNKDNSRGRGPRGFKSFHGPKSNVPGSKPHVHYDNGTSHNSDGTPHDPGRGTPNPTNAQRDYLNKNGWKPPK